MNNGYQNSKSAVAFFFLFFLYGTSIGNGQQGISYNLGICEPLKADLNLCTHLKYNNENERRIQIAAGVCEVKHQAHVGQ